jgi:N6-adenosine-specific RNA methylase IME4
MRDPQGFHSVTALVRYEAARRALAEAARVDEVKQIRDLAVAAQAYARQAQDVDLINNATDIRKRAERRAGEILREMAKTGERAVRKNMKSQPATSKLSDLGITKTQSSRWQAAAALPDDEFEKQVDAAKRKAVASVATAATTEAKKQRRANRERQLAARTIAASAALNRKTYGVIYADPPWQFEPYSRDTGMDRAADNHYPTMTLDAIKALGVPTADDCVLFLWATIPMLPEAIAVMEAWGFGYKSACVWVKDKTGTGYWFRNRFELLLVGTRGSVPAPAPGDQYPSVIEARVGAHSAKPRQLHEMIEALFPNVPKLEMFARSERDGWDQWGNEAPMAAD